jgi:hypothetical protein
LREREYFKERRVKTRRRRRRGYDEQTWRRFIRAHSHGG